MAGSTRARVMDIFCYGTVPISKIQFRCKVTEKISHINGNGYTVAREANKCGRCHHNPSRLQPVFSEGNTIPNTSEQMQPTLFLNHGGGPLPLIKNAQPSIAYSIREARPSKPPSAVLIVSAHYESSPIAVLSRPKHKLLFDYSGFPPQCYQYKYSARGDENLALRIEELLIEDGIDAKIERKRGLDHGMFVPLMLMYPTPDIPVVGLSLHPSLDVDVHMRIGRALSVLRQDNVLIVGSGYAFHNMTYLLRPTKQSIAYSKQFDTWIRSLLVGKMTLERLNKLINWKQDAPYGTECHPREEHLIPLFVAAAAAGENSTGEVINVAEGENEGEHFVSNFRFS